MLTAHNENAEAFDAVQGCYLVQASAGNCRFRVEPPPGGLPNPVFRIRCGAGGRWTGPVSITAGGRLVRDSTALDDGTVLFLLPGRLERAVTVELSGPWQER